MTEIQIKSHSEQGLKQRWERKKNSLFFRKKSPADLGSVLVSSLAKKGRQQLGK